MAELSKRRKHQAWLQMKSLVLFSDVFVWSQSCLELSVVTWESCRLFIDNFRSKSRSLLASRSSSWKDLVTPRPPLCVSPMCQSSQIDGCLRGLIGSSLSVAVTSFCNDNITRARHGLSCLLLVLWPSAECYKLIFGVPSPIRRHDLLHQARGLKQPRQMWSWRQCPLVQDSVR